MRALSFVALLAVAWAQCDDLTSCYKCMANTACGWYAVGPLSDCRRTADVPASLNLTKADTCPPCQAGNCADCTMTHPDGNCAWFKSDVPAIGGKCAVNTSTPTAYTKLDACPVCNAYDDNCTRCFEHQTSDGCNYYTLPGQNSGKCRDSSPSFLYQKIDKGFCNGNPCTSSQTCSACQAVNASGTTCAWFNSAVPSLYGPKCDTASNGVVDTTLYSMATTCPECGGASCVACKSEANCKWVAVDVGVGTGFGQCIKNDVTNPPGKTTVDICPATCQVYSCSSCIASTACRWYADSPVASPTCDLASDSWQYGTHRSTVAQGGTCGVCAASRCYECSSEAGCGWYSKTVAGLRVPGTARCKPTTGDHSGESMMAKDDEDCEGNPNGAVAMVPGFAALAVAFFVYHN